MTGKDQSKPRKTLRDYLYVFCSGIAMGAADVVPGVSGGTMAFILGIYGELLDTIKSINLGLFTHLRRGRIRDALEHVNWKFGLALGIGLASAILSLARLVTYLYEHQPVLLFSFFFGLILASIIVVGAHVRWGAVTFVCLIAGTAIAFAIVRAVPTSMPSDPLTLLWSGAVSIMAMILPGISGSFILLILGQYHHVMAAVKSLDIPTLLPFAAGAAIGLLAFARLLSWMLYRYRQAMVSFLTGFMAGSLWKIWPFRSVEEFAVSTSGKMIPIRESLVLPEMGPQVWYSALLVVAGLVIVLGLDRFQAKTGAGEIGG